MSSVMDYLKQMNHKLAEAPVQTGNTEFPDGNYVVKIEKADVVPVKAGDNAGKPQVEWWLRVTNGPAGTVNRVIFHYHRLFGRDDAQLEAAFSRFKTDLARIEQELTDFEQLPLMLAALITSQTMIRVTLKTNGTSGIQNCYFNGLAPQG